MTTPAAPRRALISVSDKTGLVPFVQQLRGLGFEIVSTGGTRRTLDEAGIAVTDIASVTGFPEIMQGRVKTLHPMVYGGILGRPDHAEDAEAMRQQNIAPFELVVCNLYPFEATISREDVTPAEAIENIDIGGPSMIRAAAKNHAYLGVVVDPDQYPRVIEALKSGPLSDRFRRELAATAFERTARYDRAIADYMASMQSGVQSPESKDERAESREDDAAFPEQLNLSFQKKAELRYGENPHQRAGWFVEPKAPAGTLAGAEPLHGKELSYNNLLDLDAALAVVRDFEEPAAVVIKHNNPCGCGLGSAPAEAFQRAYAGDPVSAFGSIIGFNRPVDAETADQLTQPNRFIEAIIAPGYAEEAFELLTTRPSWKKNVRLLRCAGLNEPQPRSWDYRRLSGGVLVQDRDDRPEAADEWRVRSSREPTEGEWRDLRFSWLVSKHVKSNAIVFAKDGGVVGVGAGQMSRLDSVFLAAHKAGAERSPQAVMASDAFFPFRDGIDAAARAGITAVIQPGGSRRDEEVIAACDEHGMALVFTGRRHFRH